MKSLKDISGETIYPKTVASAVMFDDQNTMGALASNGLYVAGETQDFEELDPINADTLQGHDSNYFASKEELNDRIDEVNTALNDAKTNGDFDGKSAYEYAKENGYTGTEEQFAKDINPENIVTTVLSNFINVSEVAL